MGATRGTSTGTDRLARTVEKGLVNQGSGHLEFIEGVITSKFQNKLVLVEGKNKILFGKVGAATRITDVKRRRPASMDPAADRSTDSWSSEGREGAKGRLRDTLRALIPKEVENSEASVGHLVNEAYQLAGEAYQLAEDGVFSSLSYSSS